MSIHLSIAAFVCHMTHTVPVWPTGLKYLLSGPLQKKFSDPRSSGMVEGRGINAVV